MLSKDQEGLAIVRFEEDYQEKMHGSVPAGQDYHRHEHRFVDHVALAYFLARLTTLTWLLARFSCKRAERRRSQRKSSTPTATAECAYWKKGSTLYDFLKFRQY
jgi:hypothetical protein